ncbi:hypothetical protein SASPL_152235 [Salvia splendens]|uniref:Uncharacterized protein n=1 Tax=Salvia splendens TaxID=180675 RepID=A0A8X8W2W6_SALSN|nr:hypothetical protein SASPL_152235 [Salvia splendens]
MTDGYDTSRRQFIASSIKPLSSPLSRIVSFTIAVDFSPSTVFLSLAVEWWVVEPRSVTLSNAATGSLEGRISASPRAVSVAPIAGGGNDMEGPNTSSSDKSGRLCAGLPVGQVREPLANRAGIRAEPLVGSAAGTTRVLEASSSSIGALDTTALAFEHVLASLACIEARLDASEWRNSVAPPPPRPDPKPPNDGWQQGRGDIMSSAITLASQQNLGFPSSIFVNLPSRTEQLSWDSRGDLRRSGIDGADNDGFRGRRATAWDNLVPKMDKPEPPYEEWQRGRGDTGKHHPIINPIQQPCDRYGAGVEGFPGRQFMAWDNPAHRFDDQPGRLVTEWDNAWRRHEVGRMADQPRYDYYRVEKPRYEKMRAPRFDGSDAGNLLAIRVHVDENRKIGAVGIEDQFQ